MKKMIVVVVAICLVISLGALNCANAQRPIKLKFNSWVPNETHPLYVNILKPWIDEVEKRTKGRVKISFYFGYTLAAHGTTLDCIESGVCDISGIVQGEYTDRLILTGIGNLPLMPPNGQVLSKALKDLFEKYSKEFRKEYRSVKVLWVNPVDLLHFFWTSPKPVRTLEGMRGLIVGSWGVDVPTLKSLGANPHRVSVATLYGDLEKKVMDGVGQNFGPFRPFHLQEVIGSITLVGFYTGVLIHAMNLDKFNSLPRDIQKIIEEVSEPNWVKTAAIFDKNAENVIEWLRTKHPEITMYTLPPKERARWLEVAKPIVEKWIEDANARGYPGRQMIDDLKSLVMKHTSR